MKFLLSVISLWFTFLSAAQPQDVLALLINYEPDPIDGGQVFLLVDKPREITLKAGQAFVCKGVYRGNPSDTGTLGTGYLRTVGENNLECILAEKGLKALPKKGDLCFFAIAPNRARTDIFYKPARYAVSFTTVRDSMLFDAGKSLGNWPQDGTTQLLDAMAADIRYTGKAMKEQSDGQQQQIKGGDYDGKMLFNAMQEVKSSEVREFIRYVNARPALYAGRTWHISEVFATWMVSGTPKVVD